MAGAAGGRNEFSIHKDAEYAFVLGICLLVPVMGPDFLGQGELGGGELAGGGRGHGVVLREEVLEMAMEKGECGGCGRKVTFIFNFPGLLKLY